MLRTAEVHDEVEETVPAEAGDSKETQPKRQAGAERAQAEHKVFTEQRPVADY